jgi:hypothetical protein
MVSKKASKDHLLQFQYDISRSSLHFIDENFLELESFLENEIILIGIDTETQPNTSTKITSLLQMALRNNKYDEKVFIIDLLSLHSKNILTKIDQYLTPLFMNSNIIKIGQGLANDFHELRTSYPILKHLKNAVEY